MLSFGPLDPIRHPLKTAWLEIDPDLVRVAVAFATEAGVDELRTRIVTPALFDAADKQWMIGIQEGVTQPYALRRLGSLAASEVRVPLGTEVLASRALRASRFFHPKLYHLENASTGSARLISASANLTHSGLRSNLEQFLVWTGQRTDAEASIRRLVEQFLGVCRPRHPGLHTLLRATSTEAANARVSTCSRPSEQ